jgi:hypothetical protein
MTTQKKTKTNRPVQPKNTAVTDGMAYIKGREFSVVAGLLLLLLLVVFYQYVSLQKVFVFKDIGSDTTNQLYPWLMYIRDCLQQGGLPAWTFHQGMGQNIYPTNGINEPFLLSTLLLGKDTLLFGIAFGQIVRIFLTGIFFYLYLLPHPPPRRSPGCRTHHTPHTTPL